MRRLKMKTAVLVCAAASLAAAVAPASASASPSASASVGAPRRGHHVVVVDCFSHQQVRPRTFLLACGDGNNGLTALRWSHWGTKSAAATGRDVVNDCQPYCAAGKFHSYRVKVRLDHPGPWKKHPGKHHYTRLRLTYSDSRPPHTPREVTYRLWN